MVTPQPPAQRPADYGELWPLFQQQARLYNLNNTSMPNETAQALMAGIRFTIEVGGNSGDIQARFAAGRQTIKRRVLASRSLLYAVGQTARPTENQSYTDTLVALPDFFKTYDTLFFPQDIACDIDYQTALPMLGSALQGVFWVHEYLRRILLENQFCARFSAAECAAVQWGAYPALRDDLVNLYTPVLLAALGANLLERPDSSLLLRSADQIEIECLLKDLPKEELYGILLEKTKQVCLSLFPKNKALHSYAHETIAYLAPGIYTAIQSGNIGQVFPLPAGPTWEAAPAYEEGQALPAGVLRTLIEEAKTCRFTRDKLAILRREIHSLRDFTDFTENCLADEEYPSAFALLAAPEIKALCERLATEYPDDPPRWGRLLLAWLKAGQAI